METESKTFRVTHAGRVFMRFMATFNMGDPEAMREFIEENYTDDLIAEHSVDGLVAWHMETYESTGGLQIHRVYLTQEYYIIVIVKSKADGTVFMDKMKITEETPYKIIEYFHEPSPISG